MPISATTAFQNCTTANRDCLLTDLIAVEVTHEGAVTGGTHESQARSWRRFQEYVESIGLGHNCFLVSFNRPQQDKIMCAFAMAMRQVQFSGPSHDRLVEGTIRNTILNVCSTFRENGRPNPTKDKDMQLASFYHDYTEHSRTKIQTKCNKRLSPPALSSQ